jgi:signal transduction histidine kinase
MNDEEHRLMRESALSFFGSITASLSHELSNSVAIINELAGLTHDILPDTRRKARVDCVRLRELAQRITSQVKRGQDTIRKLNRFAHSVDDPFCEFDLRKLLEEIVSLAQRFASLKRVDLEPRLTDDSLIIRSDPFRMQQAIFGCIQLALEGSGRNDIIIITLDATGSDVRVTVENPNLKRTENFDSTMTFISLLAESLQGRMENSGHEGDERRLTLCFPELIDE